LTLVSAELDQRKAEIDQLKQAIVDLKKSQTSPPSPKQKQPKTTRESTLAKIEKTCEKLQLLKETASRRLQRTEKRIRDNHASRRQKWLDDGVGESDPKIKNLDKKLESDLKANAEKIKSEQAQKLSVLEKELKQLEASIKE